LKCTNNFMIWLKLSDVGEFRFLFSNFRGHCIEVTTPGEILRGVSFSFDVPAQRFGLDGEGVHSDLSVRRTAIVREREMNTCSAERRLSAATRGRGNCRNTVVRLALSN
jgi:hypothetical protein